MYRTLFILILINGLSGCSDHHLPDHDLQYYKSHLGEAKNKRKECIERWKKALNNPDRSEGLKALKILSENLSCIAANEVYSEFIAEKEMLEREKRFKKLKIKHN